MYLVKYQDGMFIDAKEIDWLEIKPGIVKFSIKSDPCGRYNVAEQYHVSFLNKMQLINANGCCDLMAEYSEKEAGDERD